MVKYVLHYVEDCSPKVAKFNKKRDLDKFCKKFKKENKYNKEDNWLDYYVKGINMEFNGIDSYWGIKSYKI